MSPRVRENLPFGAFLLWTAFGVGTMLVHQFAAAWACMVCATVWSAAGFLASAIEARSGETTQIGSTEGESAMLEEQTPGTPRSSDDGDVERVADALAKLPCRDMEGVSRGEHDLDILRRREAARAAIAAQVTK